MTKPSRRTFLASAAGLAATATPISLFAKQAAGVNLTAAAVIQRIKDKVGVPWRAETVDRIIAGTPDTRVRGVATTMMSTLDVVQRAAAAGRNMIVTHEPTFYSHQDTREPLAQDPTYQFKDRFLRDHDIVIFRFHDHWHARRPDGIATGMMRELGWEKNVVDPMAPRQFRFEGIRLEALAKHMRAKLNARAIRVVGDPGLTVNRVAASWGYYTFNPANLATLNGVDVFIVGETREWETVEYVQDMIASGKKKALIILGHVVSEQAGMKYCAEWLKGFVSEVPIEFIAAPEPFWPVR
jgi:putative NIF3 family GTP cyclohydrolase 1 type 2